MTTRSSYGRWLLSAAVLGVVACGGAPSDSRTGDDTDDVGTIEQPGLQRPAAEDVGGAVVDRAPEFALLPEEPRPEVVPAPVSEVPAATPLPATQPQAAVSCPAKDFLQSVGKSKLLIGGKMDDDFAAQAPFDLRYLYLAGGLQDGATACTSCNSCTAASVSCANSGPGCQWWGCWQDSDLPPGEYVQRFLAKTKAAGHLALISYYQHFPNSGLLERAQMPALNDVAKLTRYFNDWRFVLQKVGTARVLLHLEPDLWGYAQQANPNPTSIAAQVRAANPSDCSGQPDNFAGFGRCMVAMARKYAPNAKVGVHASSWGSGPDATLNSNPALNVAAVGTTVADFLLATGGAESDFVVFEMNDRDAGWYSAQGQNRWLDATNATLPNFTQMFAFSKAVASRMQKPALFWQIPLGNMALPDQPGKWRDNRVQYFFDHPGELAAAGFFGVAFGSGNPGQTEPTSDNGYYLSRAKAYFAAGGQSACE